MHRNDYIDITGGFITMARNAIAFVLALLALFYVLSEVSFSDYDKRRVTKNIDIINAKYTETYVNSYAYQEEMSVYYATRCEFRHDTSKCRDSNAVTPRTYLNDRYSDTYDLKRDNRFLRWE